MQKSSCLFTAFVLAGCGTAQGGFRDAASDPGEGGAGAVDGGSNGSGAGTGRGGSGGAGERRELGPPTELVPGQAALVGVTSDGWAIFRNAEGLHAVSVASRPEVEAVSERPGNVVIRGKAVFNWADVDWENNVGDLSVWTSEAKVQDIGSTMLAERLIAVNDRGSAIVYTENADEESADLVVATSDFSSSQVVVEAMGLGSEETCGASIGFVADRLFVAWCEPGNRAGRIERFEESDGEWRATLIDDEALPVWSADEDGERLFFLSSTYRAQGFEDGMKYPIDRGVSRGSLLPDGSAAFYTVGDQLRRSSLPDVNPIPVVTRGYSAPIEFSPTFEHALYSSIVNYDDGTRRDLLLVPTDAVDAVPVELAREPIARLGRSRMTADGRFVLFLTDESHGTSLHVVSVEGDERFLLPNVVEVIAAHGSTIVFTDDPSDPEVYPVVSDLKILDVARDSEPELVEAKIIGTRGFYVDANRENVVYVRSGVDREADAPDRTGLYYRSLR